MKSKLVAYLLLLFFGVLGVHKFYIGQPVAGVLRLLTLNFLLVGYFIDLFKLSTDVDLVNAKLKSNNTANTQINIKL
ncbi:MULTISPECIES: NINE protein [Bacillus]|uniref:NINE protein n=1 Tax=Bacillus TaxID=1386 RepID=UPI0011A7EDC7|nr:MULTISPECIES: NINE protein [Bacillus]MDX9635994.1 NINE protein [Bacillus sp. PBL-C9]